MPSVKKGLVLGVIGHESSDLGGMRWYVTGIIGIDLELYINIAAGKFFSELITFQIEGKPESHPMDTWYIFFVRVKPPPEVSSSYISTVYLIQRIQAVS